MQKHKVSSLENALPKLKKVFSKARQNLECKQALLSDPESVLREAGIDLPQDINLQIFEDTPTLKYFSVSQVSNREQASHQIAALWRLCHRYRNGMEIRLLHNTQTQKYLVFR